MATAFHFSTEQLAEVGRLRDELTKPVNGAVVGAAVPLYAYVFQCVTGIEVPGTESELTVLQGFEVQAQAKQIGFWQIYEWLADLLMQKGVSSMDSTVLWLRGAPRFLDMLMGAATGQNLIGTTTEANLAERARAFFNGHGDTLATIDARMLPTVHGCTAAANDRTMQEAA